MNIPMAVAFLNSRNHNHSKNGTKNYTKNYTDYNCNYTNNGKNRNHQNCLPPHYTANCDAIAVSNIKGISQLIQQPKQQHQQHQQQQQWICRSTKSIPAFSLVYHHNKRNTITHHTYSKYIMPLLHMKQCHFSSKSSNNNDFNSANHDDALTKIKSNIQKQTVQGFNEAIQILYNLIHECHHHHNHNHPKNDNTGMNTVVTLDEVIPIVNLILTHGRKLASNDSCNDYTIHNLNDVALDLLQHMEALIHQDNYTQPNHHQHHHHHQLQKMYNLIIDIISKNGKSNNSTIIHEIIDKITNAPQQYNIQPDAITYNALLYSYSQKPNPNSAEETETLLRQLIEYNKPHDVISYNIVLNAWAKNNTHDKDPLTKTNKKKRAADRAEMLLIEMQRRYLDYSHVHVKPNVRSFTILLDAYSNSNDLDAAKKATELLYFMEELSGEKEGGSGGSGGSGCDDNDNESLRPNLFMYNSVLNAWSKSSLPGSSQCAQDLLDRMIDNCITHHDKKGEDYVIVRPNTISFAICIKAHARGDEKGSSDKALALLKRMLELYKHYGFDTKPDTGTFNSVLRALNNDSNEDQATKAENLLRQMKEMGLHPDLTSYNHILRCCCNTKTNDVRLRRSALRIATETLLAMKQSNGVHAVIPDPYTFNFFIKTCDRLTNGEEKIKLIKAAFQYCIQEGKFSKPVLSIMKNALKPNELRDILQLEDGTGTGTSTSIRNLQDLKISDFPEKWRSRVSSSSTLSSHHNRQRHYTSKRGR